MRTSAQVEYDGWDEVIEHVFPLRVEKGRATVRTLPYVLSWEFESFDYHRDRGEGDDDEQREKGRFHVGILGESTRRELLFGKDLKRNGGRIANILCTNPSFISFDFFLPCMHVPLS